MAGKYVRYTSRDGKTIYQPLKPSLMHRITGEGTQSVVDDARLEAARAAGGATPGKNDPQAAHDAAALDKSGDD